MLMPKETILIVEDNEINLRLAKLALAAKDFNIVAANSAEEALEILKNLRPKIILMDLQLPGMDGLQLTTLLKKNPETKDIIIIALTAIAMPNDSDKALKAGCNGYISKPYSVRTLATEIAMYIKND